MCVDDRENWRELNGERGVKACGLDVNEGYRVLLSVFTDCVALLRRDWGAKYYEIV